MSQPLALTPAMADAVARWLEGADFKTNVKKDADISGHLSPAEIDACFDTAYPLRNIDTIMARFGL